MCLCVCDLCHIFLLMKFFGHVTKLCIESYRKGKCVWARMRAEKRNSCVGKEANGGWGD